MLARLVYMTLLLALPLAHGVATPSVVHADGIGGHFYVTESTCIAEDARFVVDYAQTAGRITVVSDSECVVPYWSVISGCQKLADATIRCATGGAGETVRATLSPGGAFNLTWSAPTFYEAIQAQLVRTDL